MPEPTLDDLRAMLQDRAHATPAPAFAEELLGDRIAEQRQTARRRFGAVAAAAAVAAAIVAVTIPHLGSGSTGDNQPPATGSTSTGSPSGTPLERGPAPKVAYTVGNQLRYPGADGEVSVDLGGHPSGLHQAGDLVMVTVDDTRLRVFQLGADHDVVDEPTTGPGLLSADGLYAAWVKPGSGKPVVAVRTLDGNDPADRTMTFPDAASCCDNPFNLIGITSDGRLIAWMGALMKTWTWDFEHNSTSVTQVRSLTRPDAPAGVDGGPVIPLQVAGDRLLVEYDGGGYGIGSIAADGRWQPESSGSYGGALQSGNRILLSPDGTRAVYFTGQSDLKVFLGSAPPLALGAPADQTESVIAFESDDSVLVSTAADKDGRVLLVRCALQSGVGVASSTCERAGTYEGDVSLPVP